MTRGPIFVTKSTLPPLDEMIPHLQRIWDSKILSNGGPYHQKLEAALSRYLGVDHICLFANGTLALLVALKSLRIIGEVITTPFSFVATSHSLLWNGIKPVFVDIDPETLNLNPEKIESSITPETTAILPVHCYGHPCATEALQKIADTYNLKIVYDACHAFGVKDQGGSITRHGDLSVLSFHATKVFNTFEGGAIVCPDIKTKNRIDQLKNFGHAGETSVVATGINGKMSEFNAALGLLQLDHIDHALARRQVIDGAYRDRLRDIKGIRCLGQSGETVSNYAYFPIIVDFDYAISRDALNNKLKDRDIHPRRYFYPLISEFPMYRDLPSARRANLPIAYSTSLQILCLPIYPDLDILVVDEICDVIRSQ
jgi:dTDP-4-amino-4,6-dideoxygalactose transaminase